LTESAAITNTVPAGAAWYNPEVAGSSLVSHPKRKIPSKEGIF
jgi:hypothetical protein